MTTIQCKDQEAYLTALALLANWHERGFRRGVVPIVRPNVKVLALFVGAKVLS